MEFVFGNGFGQEGPPNPKINQNLTSFIALIGRELLSERKSESLEGVSSWPVGVYFNR